MGIMMAPVDIDINQLGECLVYNESGQTIELSTLWEKNPALLIFVRHFGWLICRQQVAELGASSVKFENKGISLIVIGSGESGDLRPFKEATGYQGIMLTDPGRKTYQLLNFKDGITNVIGLKSFAAGFSALKSGQVPGAMKGSALQLGGAIVITPDKMVPYYYQSQYAGDHPPISELLEAVAEPR